MTRIALQLFVLGEMGRTVSAALVSVSDSVGDALVKVGRNVGGGDLKIPLYAV
ncbi:hypothetical protein ABZ905_23920 [Streptomyces parvus]|uniref:hypothetical protein n=1 Tax=Streptomyces TaxID=1883 RepID=UPI00136CD724|nr:MULTISPECIES: hypothetical protein [unclassified Streptomyces]MYW99400.1 hypothetical protein [Streptomyces sp. SID8378]